MLGASYLQSAFWQLVLLKRLHFLKGVQAIEFKNKE
jgi:hypothetical protein